MTDQPDDEPMTGYAVKRIAELLAEQNEILKRSPYMVRLIGNAYVSAEAARERFLRLAQAAFSLTEEQASALWDELRERFAP